MAGNDDDAIFGFDRRKALVTAGATVVLAVGAVAALGQVTDYDRLVDALMRADPWWLGFALLGQLLAYAGYVIGYRSIARAFGGPLFDWWTTIRVVAVSFGAYVLGAAAGGLAVDFWALHRAGEDVHQAGRRVLGFNTLQWLVLGTFATVAAGLALTLPSREATLGMTLGWLIVVPVCVAAATWVSAGRRGERLQRLPAGDEPDDLRSPSNWLPWAWVKLRKGFSDAIGGVAFVRRIVARPASCPGAPVGFAIYWAGDILTLWAALEAFGGEVDTPSLVLAYATAYVVAASPLPAGAAGFAEAALAGALAAVGVPFATAIVAALVYRGFTFWLPIPIALAFLPTVKRLNEELPEKERRED